MLNITFAFGFSKQMIRDPFADVGVAILKNPLSECSIASLKLKGTAIVLHQPYAFLESLKGRFMLVHLGQAICRESAIVKHIAKARVVFEENSDAGAEKRVILIEEK